MKIPLALRSFLALLWAVACIEASAMRRLSSLTARTLAARTSIARSFHSRKRPSFHRVHYHPILASLQDREDFIVPAKNGPFVEALETTHYRIGATVLTEESFLLHEAQTKKTLQPVTVQAARHVFPLQDPTEEMHRFDRIQQATREVHEALTEEDDVESEQGSIFSRARDRYALPEHIDHFPLKFGPGIVFYQVLEPMRPLSLRDYMRSLGQLEERERERGILGVILSLLGAVHHIHKVGYLHGDLQEENILVELVDGLPVVRLLNFQALPIGHLPWNNRLENPRHDYEQIQRVLSRLLSPAMMRFTASETLDDLGTAALAITNDVEAMRFIEEARNGRWGQ